MVQFAEYQKPPSDPNYLGMSKDIDVPRVDNSVASAISDVTKIAVAGVNAVDEMNKNTIDKQLLAGVNQRRQEDIRTGLDVLAGTETPTPSNEDGSPNVPTALDQGLRRAAHLTQAKKMGKVADELYYGDMQQIAQNLTSRYPGYERYIQDRMSHWLGTNPANAQRAAIINTLQTQYAEKNSEANRWTTFVRANLEHFSNPDGTFNQAMLAKAQNAFGNPQAMADIETFVARSQSRKQATAQAVADLELESKRGTVTETRALAAYRTAATEEFNRVATKGAFTVGGMSFNGMRDVEEQIAMIKQSGGKVDPEVLALFGQAVGQYSNEADAAMRKLANDPRFMQHIQNTAKLAEIRAELLGNFKNISDEVGSGNLRLATATFNTFEGMSNNDGIRALRGNDTLRRWNQIRQTAGPGASIVIERELSLDQKLPTIVSEQLKLLNMQEIVSGGPVTMQTLVTRFNTAHGITGTPTPQQQAERATYLQSAMRFAKNVATGQDVPPIMRENAARFIASGGTTEFLQALPPEQQMAAWANLASPETAKAMKATLPPGQWREYRTWAQETFKALSRIQIAQVTQGDKDSQGTNITFDESSGQLRFDNSRRTSQGRSGPVPIGNNTINAINELNLGLQTYGNILKLDGKKLDAYELEAVGIRLQKPEVGGSKGSGKGSKRTSEAPNGSEGPSMVSFITPAMASGQQIPPSDRVREGFRAIRTMEDDNPSRFIYDDAGVRDQLQQHAAMLPENRFNPRPGRVPDNAGGGVTPTRDQLPEVDIPTRQSVRPGGSSTQPNPGLQRYEIIDTQTGRAVGTYNTPNRSWYNRAKKRLDKLNEGGDRYQIRPILEQPSPFPSPR